MIRAILFLWILLQLDAPAWCYVLLGISFFADMISVISNNKRG